MIDAWKFKTLHDSTFEATDVVHKIVDMLYMSTVAAAAAFIKPYSVMDDLDNGFAYGLSLSLIANVIVLGAQKLEVRDPACDFQSRPLLLFLLVLFMIDLREEWR